MDRRFAFPGRESQERTTAAPQSVATVDVQAFRGWFVGDFVPRESGVRSTPVVEVKWQSHACGEARREWEANRARERYFF